MTEQKTKIEEIYEMKLHETITNVNDFTIIRVPGGWVYRFFHAVEIPYGGVNYLVDSVFVPFDNEFQIEKV